MSSSREAPVLLVSPHLDDAVLSVGATIAALTTAGAQVLICTVFAGRPKPPFSPVADAFHADCGLGPDAIEIRRKEDLAALTLLGADALHLDFLDAVYRRTGDEWVCRSPRAMFDPGQPPEPALLNGIAREVHRLIETFEPAQVWTCAAIGQHVDHRITRAAVTLACAGTRRLLLWEDLPYAFNYRPPHQHGVESPPIVHAEHLELKLAALARYSSQLRMLWPRTDWRRLVVGHAMARQGVGGLELSWPSAPAFLQPHRPFQQGDAQ